MSLTKTSTHPLNPIYERLRKRSYRQRVEKVGRALWNWEQRFEGKKLHKAYVAGVKDALNEVANQ